MKRKIIGSLIISFLFLATTIAASNFPKDVDDFVMYIKTFLPYMNISIGGLDVKDTLAYTNLTLCPNGQILETAGGVWSCTPKPGGASGVNMWVDNGTWLTPNVSYANNINLSEGTGWLDALTILSGGKALGELFIGEGNRTGNTTPEIMTVINLSNINTIGNITTQEYFFGPTIEGNIGSGIIWCDSIDSSGNVNLTHVPGQTTIRYPNMTVRLVKTDNTVKHCNITSAWVTPTDDQHSVYYVDSNCAVQSTSFAAYVATDLSPGGLADIFNVMRHAGEIESHKGVTVKNKEDIKSRKTVLKIAHLRTVSGLGITTETFPNFTIAEGEYQYIREVANASEQNITRGDGLELVYRIGGTWQFVETNDGINLTDCDDGTDTAPCSTPALYRRYFIFLVGFADSEDHTEIHQLLADEDITYARVGDCLNTVDNPLIFTMPDIYDYSGVMVWAYCGRGSDSAWSGNFIDMRAVQTGSASTDIDTSIFLTVDGTRPLTSNWNAIFNISLDTILGNWNGSDALNTSMGNYIRGVNLTMDAYVDALNNSMSSLIAYYNTSMNTYVNALNNSISLLIAYYNTSMDTYVDAMDALFNSSIKSYADSQDIAYNTSMKGYCDSQDTVFNTSMGTYVIGVNLTMDTYVDAMDLVFNTSLSAYARAYADLIGSDANDTLFNASMKTYVDSQDVAFNTSMKEYVDSTEVNTDTNASSICSGDQVLLGNGSCQSSADYGGGISIDNITIDQQINASNITWGEIVGFTPGQYTGNITNGSLIGYDGANAICNVHFPESHFCLEVEVMKTAKGDYTGEYWMAKGAPGYTAAANDCEGWTKVTSEIGPFWDWDENAGRGAGKLTPCSSTLQLMCCK